VTQDESVDVVVVGGGNAGFSAAHAAAARGRRVVILEKGQQEESGGNSYYTAGAMRVAHGGLDDLVDILEPDERLGSTVLPTYPEDRFDDDMERITGGASDPDLTETLISDSLPTLQWLHDLGLQFRLMYERQAYLDSDQKYVFWGGLAVGTVGGGKGLMAAHTRIAREAQIDVRYGHAGTSLEGAPGQITGVRYVKTDGFVGLLNARSVILAAGGFEANPELREKYLGQGWRRAKVRGTPLNTGEMLEAAIARGAQPYGDWSTCHSVAWDANAAPIGNRELTNQLSRGGYPLGIMVNKGGFRFVDEGADFRNYTYAKYGAEILKQDGGIAFQIFDGRTRALLRTEEYDSPGASVFMADSIERLGEAAGIDPGTLLRTVKEYNEGIDDSRPFDPSILDRRASTATPPKSNWAQPLMEPPFYAFAVTCGITFTFGGLRANTKGQVLDSAGAPIGGLFVCGEMLGGLFSGNYPGGTGLTSGAVFGRRAGSLA
jgi:tricarballylate dehydrogenase